MSLGGVIAGEALALAYDAAPQIAAAGLSYLGKRYFDGTPKMTQQGGGVPVTLMTGTMGQAGSKTSKFKGKVPLSKRVKLGQNLITYTWQACTPYHAKFGAISIANATNVSPTHKRPIGADSILQNIPIHLYDLTCVPNYVRPDADELIYDIPPVANPNVNYQFIMESKMKGNLSTEEDRVPSAMYAYPGTNADYPITTQKCDGELDENKWQMKYVKRPRIYFAAGVPGDIVQTGINTSDSNTSGNAARTLPAGRRPIHLSTKVKMCLVGTAHQAVTYDISLVRFKTDHLVPQQSWARLTDPDGERVMLDPIQTTWLSGNNNYENGMNGNEAVMFWQSMAMKFTHGPESSPDGKLLAKHCQILGSKTITIQPKTTIDGDTNLNHTYVNFKFDWNDQRSYAWRKDGDSGLGQAAPFIQPNSGVKAGIGFPTNIADAGNCTTHVSPTSRVFLMVRCRSAFKDSTTFQYDACTVDGTVAGRHGDVDWCPTYDISIDNTFIPDAP